MLDPVCGAQLRKSWAVVDGKQLDLHREFDALPGRGVSYATFRVRVRSLQRRGLLCVEALRHAAQYGRRRWIAFYGGGRARSFVYKGNLYPQVFGQRFRSVSSFLLTIGQQKKLHVVWNRLKRRWNLDAAINEPVLAPSVRRGLIYCLASKSTGLRYVGLTVCSVDARWRQHRDVALSSSSGSALHQAIRRLGPSDFQLAVLERDLPQAALGARERFWISKLGTLAPAGLNMSHGGQLGGCRGIRTRYGTRVFQSRSEASSVLANETGLAPHVVQARLATGRPMPNRARRASNHPEAGSKYWRIWKSLVKRTAEQPRSLSDEWLSYDRFKADTQPSSQPSYRLTRINHTEPWSAANFAWRPARDIVERTHGKPFIALGRSYPSMKAISSAYRIGWTTFKDRIHRQGMTVEQAVTRPLGPTSRRPHASTPT